MSKAAFQFPIWLWRQVAQCAFNARRCISQHPKGRIANLAKDSTNFSRDVIMIYVKRSVRWALFADRASASLRTQQLLVALVSCYLKKHLQATISCCDLFTRFAVTCQPARLSLVKVKVRRWFNSATPPALLLSRNLNDYSRRQLETVALGPVASVLIATRSTIGLMPMVFVRMKFRQRFWGLTSSAFSGYDGFGQFVHPPMMNILARPVHSFPRVFGPSLYFNIRVNG